MKRYVERVVDSIYKRGDIREVDGSNININCYGHKVVNGFHSVFMFGEEMPTHVTETGAIRGFTGPTCTDALIWDLDHSTDPSKSLDDTRELLDRLESMGASDKSIRVYFSGNKGFHVYFLSGDIKRVGLSVKTHLVTKGVCLEIADGLPTVDESIYDKTRIIRIPNSIHEKTTLFKVPVSVEDIRTMSISDIQKYAETQHQISYDDVWDDVEFIKYAIESHMSNTDVGTARKTSRSSMLDGLYTGFDNGNRNVGLSSLAGMLHGRNLSNDFIHAIVTSVNAQGSDPLSETALNTIVDSVSTYPVMEDYKEPDDDEILTMEGARQKWESIKGKRQYLKSGFASLDEHLVNFDPGKVMMVAARSGVGKTALGMQIANTLAKSQDGYNLFVSLEMPASAIYYRAAQIEMNKVNVFKEANEFSESLLKDEDMKARTLGNWANTLMVDKDGVTVEKIEKYYLKANEMYNGQVKFLLIDYVGLIGNTDDYRGLSKVAREIKNIAKRLNIRIILLVQLSRGAGDGTLEPRLDMLRDSGSLEEAADMVLGMWCDPSENMRIHNKFLKNRDGVRGAKFDLLQTGLSYECVPFEESVVQEDNKRKW